MKVAVYNKHPSNGAWQCHQIYLLSYTIIHSELCKTLTDVVMFNYFFVNGSILLQRATAGLLFRQGSAWGFWFKVRRHLHGRPARNLRGRFPCPNWVCHCVSPTKLIPKTIPSHIRCGVIVSQRLDVVRQSTPLAEKPCLLWKILSR